MKRLLYLILFSIFSATGASATEPSALSSPAETWVLLNGIYDTRDAYCSINVQINPQTLDLYAEAIHSLRNISCGIEGQVFVFHFLGNGKFATVADIDSVTRADLRNCGKIWWCRALKNKNAEQALPQVNDRIEVRTVYSAINLHSFLNDYEVRLLRGEEVVQDWFISGETTLYSRRYSSVLRKKLQDD